MGSSLYNVLSPLLLREGLSDTEILRALSAFSGKKSSLFEATREDLDSVFENSNAAELIQLCAALASRAGCESFSFGKTHSEEEIKNFLTSYFLNVGRESVVMLSLDSKDRVVALDRIGEGTINLSSVIPRMLIEKAVIRKSDKIILAHNHPGGESQPSLADVASTRTLRALLLNCGITLVSHYAVGGGKATKIETEGK